MSHPDPSNSARTTRRNAKSDSIIGGDGEALLLQRAQEALQKSEARFRTLIESVGEGVHVIDTEGRVTFENPFACQLLGWELNELLGQSAHAMMHHTDANGVCYPPEDCPIYATMRDGATRRVNTEVFWRKDGTSFPVEYVSAPFRDENGVITGCVVSFRDITEQRKAADAIRLSESRLRALIASMDDIAFEFDANGTYVEVWTCREDLLAVPRVELIGRRVADIVGEEFGTLLLGIFRRVIQSRTSENMDYSMDVAIGRRHFLGRISPIINADGTCERVCMLSRDVSERERVQDELRQSEAALRLAQQVAHLGSWEMDLRNLEEVGGNRVQWSDETFRICGFQPNEIAVTDGVLLDLLHPADRDRVQAGFAQLLRQGTPYSLNHRIIRPDGIERAIHQEAMIIYDEGSKRPLKVIGTIQDITDRKLAEEALRLSVAQFRAMFDSAAIGIALVDGQGRAVKCNPAVERMLGYTQEELSGMRFPEFTHPDDIDADLKLYRSLAAGEREHYELEKRYLRKDGQIVWGRLTVSLIRQTEGVPPLAIGMFENVTERRKLEEQFLRAQRMESIGTLAGGIAHDLNNMLGPIILALDLLKEKFPNPETQELLSTIASNAQRGASMVSQVLSFARGVEGRHVELQLKHVIRDIEKIANDTFFKHIQVRTIIPNDLWTILGDPTQLHQVLLNLCVNARDAMPNGGMLTISSENVIIDAHYAGLNLEARPGPYVFLQVEDSGAGMPPEIIAKIFDPFFTTKEVGKGTGLGLSTALGIVKSHGGFLQVYSEPGKGTTFKVYFPAQTEGSVDIAAEIATQLPRGNGELILVIDDEATVREITRQTLEAFGYRVVLASDGAEGLALFAGKSAEISTVLTDIMMPTMDSLAAIRVLRRLNSKVPIVAASGLAANAHVAQIASLGVQHFLPKPYTAETLLKTLRQALAQQP